MTHDLAYKLVNLCIALIGVTSIPGLIAAYLADSTRDMLKKFGAVIFVCITLLAIALYINTEYL